MRYHGQERGCPFMQGPDTFRHRVCLHCRNGHQSNKPGSARHNSRRWVPPGPYLKDHGGYYVDTGLTQVSAKLRAVSQVQLMDLVSER